MTRFERQGRHQGRQIRCPFRPLSRTQKRVENRVQKCVEKRCKFRRVFARKKRARNARARRRQSAARNAPKPCAKTARNATRKTHPFASFAVQPRGAAGRDFGHRNGAVSARVFVRVFGRETVHENSRRKTRKKARKSAHEIDAKKRVHFCASFLATVLDVFLRPRIAFEHGTGALRACFAAGCAEPGSRGPPCPTIPPFINECARGRSCARLRAVCAGL